MKYLALILVFGLIGCKKEASKKQDLSCMDGYLVYDVKSGVSGFCNHYRADEDGMIAYDCYDVSWNAPRVNIKAWTIRNGYVAKTKCYNADREAGE